MSTSAGQVAAFAGVIALGALSPGPDFAVVVRRSAVSGRVHGMATAAGIAVGIFVWAIAAVTGVAALLAASATAFTVVKLAGAAYLGYLGARALVAAARRDGNTVAEQDNDDGTTALAAFRQGLLCNALNPKAAVFFVALMPQFLRPDATTVDTLTLALVALAVVLLWFMILANLVAAIRSVLTRPPVRRAIDAITGVALIGLGVRLAAFRV
jgi:RhtB (resistance to homoserine/threonine) family protein